MQQRTQQQLFYFSTFILIFGLVYSNSIPISLEHPVNDFILRYYSLGIVKTIHPGERPFSIEQVIEALDEISTIELTQNEKKLVNYFKKEFDYNYINEGLIGPWQSDQFTNAIKGIFSKYSPKTNKIRFLSYKDEELALWIDWWKNC